MNTMDFFSERFGTVLEGPLQFGDEVMDEYGELAVVLRDPYPVGTDHVLFTQINYGYHMSSRTVHGLKKTGRNFSKELEIIWKH